MTNSKERRSFLREVSPIDTIREDDKVRYELIEKICRECEKWIDIDCPFCLNKGNTAFTVAGHNYLRCVECDSLFASPRIPVEKISKYYNSIPTDLMIEPSLRDVRASRIDKLIRPRWKMVKEKLIRNGVKFPVNQLMEVGPGNGYFLEVLNEDRVSEKQIAVEPDKTCLKSLEKIPGTEVFCDIFESIDTELCSGNDLVFLNSVIEHPYDLRTFFKKLAKTLKKSGKLVIVDMHASGLDIEILKENTSNIVPLQILQIASVKGLKVMADSYGFSLLNVFSMGQLDVDLLYEYSIRLKKEHPMQGFSRLLNNPDLRRDLQKVLQKHLATGYNGYIFQKK